MLKEKGFCLLYTSDAADDLLCVDLGGRRIIKSVTDFGIFVGLEGEIDGLIHLSDITEDENPAEAMESYKKGDKLSCIIFGIDAERERISLKLSA